MKILYSITIIAIYVLFILIHKTEKKQNLIIWLGITTICTLISNVIVCVILTSIEVLCTLRKFKHR